MGGDQASPDRALPARAPLPPAHRARGRLAAGRDRGVARPAGLDRARRRRREPWQRRLARPDRGALRRRQHRRHRLLLRPDVLHRLDGRAHARRPAQPCLQPPAAPLARLLRAQPRRRAHEPADQRRRGARPARDRRLHLARPEHPHAARRGRDPLPALLAARARDDDRAARPQRGHGRLPHASRPAPTAGYARRSARSRRCSPRTSPACACSRPSRREQRARARFREVGEAYRVKNQETVVQNALYFPFVDLLSTARDGDHPRLRRLPRLRPQHDDRGADRVPRLRGELLRPRPAALPALQHVPDRGRGARQNHGGAR